MKVMKKRITRILFVIYLYNKFYFNFEKIPDTLWNDCLDSFEITEKDVDWDLLHKLQTNECKIDECLIDYNNMDWLTASVIRCGLVELSCNWQPKLIISEALKIADLLNLNDKYINGFLDNYVKQQIQKEEPTKNTLDVSPIL
jgi:transcription termination factor NusB